MPSNADLTRRWFKEVWNEQREETIDELFAADGIAHGLADGQRQLPGPQAFREFWNKFRQAFPDIKIKIEDVISERDKTVVRFSFKATHTGEGLGMPPTNKKVKGTGITITRWKNGKLVEGWNEFDVMGLMQQLGAAPAKSVRA